MNDAKRARREAEEKERQAKAMADRYLAEGRIKIHAEIINNEHGSWFKPGSGKTEWFKDFEAGPEMVVVPAGSFIMGSPEDEPDREIWQKGTESPQREVTIAKPFAVGRFAVTFDEWDACVADGGGNGYQPNDKGWGRGRRPVIDVSWDDAQAYISWLSDKTGQPYRLLTEAQWEFVTRAGTTTPFWWGQSITPEQANFEGNYDYEAGGSKGEFRHKTVPVDRFAANPWGLFNVHGNVWEWCEDVWHDNYDDAPSDGLAWLQDGDTSRRVVRGGSWGNYPGDLRAALRLRDFPGDRFRSVGFRLARTLNP